VKRLLLVSHRPISQEGGPAARWRSLARRLPDLGWELDLLSAPERVGNVEFTENSRAQTLTSRRATVMGAVGRASKPAFALAGVRPEAMPLSMAWVPRGAISVRRRLREAGHDLVVATGPPMAGVLAARAGRQGPHPPLIVEFRDLWAGNPSFDLRGGLLGAIEAWTLRQAAAVVACTPEAADDLRRRHPQVADRVREIPNGFEPELLERRNGGPLPSSGKLTILHSGTLVADRPLAPLLRLLARDPWRDSFRLVLHGYLTPQIANQVREFGDAVRIEVLPPSGWSDAVSRIAASDVGLVTQARGAGDATAVASKVYEYLALGKPVLCLTHGGATEALLRRLGADELCGRLDNERSIERSLERLRDRRVSAPLEPAALARYDRHRLAGEMAALLDDVARAATRIPRASR
jgi:glycosyltransferase involved in cell wall biosynthesis